MRSVCGWVLLHLAVAADLHPAQAAPGRKAGEYFAELARKPTKLAGPIGLTQVLAHKAELAAQLDARAAPCDPDPGAVHRATTDPVTVSELEIREAHADAHAANTSHLVVRRGDALLMVRARLRPVPHSSAPALIVEETDPPLCAEEPEDDGGQVLGKETQIVEDTLKWVQGEVDARRLEECAGEAPVLLSVQHATIKVAAGFIVGLVLQAQERADGLDPKFPESVAEKAQDAVPDHKRGREAFFHRVIITWEYAPFRTVQDALTQGAIQTDETHFLVPFGQLPVGPCALIGESSFTVGTLPVAEFFQKYNGYRGFDKGKEHVDLIPPTEPKVLLATRKSRTLRVHKKADLASKLLRGSALKEDSKCPKVCPEGYSRHFADLYFRHGDSSCYDECECSSDANYATICNKCCRVGDDDACDATDPEEHCDDIPEIPETFDLREEHAECFPPTIVEDQGLCGSCFAFATVGATGDRICMANKERMVDEQGYRHILSVQNFLSCNEPEDDPEFPSLMPKKWGCDGGYFLAAARYLLRTGTVLQDHYPYSSKCVMEGTGVVNDKDNHETMLGARKTTCERLEKWLPRDLLPCSCQGYSARMRTCAKADAPEIKIMSLYRLPNVMDISPHTGTFYKSWEVERMMQLDLMTEGTLYAALKIYEDFDSFFYEEPDGVFYHRMGQLVGGHAIVIVGWGVKDGLPYWLIRNSWGVNWGDGGHFRVRRGTNECGIEGRVWGSYGFEHEDGVQPQAVNPWTLYGYYEGKTFDGHDLRQEDPSDLAHLKEVCKFDANCVGFDSSGMLKKGMPELDHTWKALDAPIEHGDRVGTSVGGFYTKLTREKVILQTSTQHGVESGTLGPLEVYLCDGNEECAPVPVEITGILPGKQTFEKDAWLPVNFHLKSVQVHNRNHADSWVPSGPMVVALPTRPGSPRIQTERFNLAGSFAPEEAPWEGKGNGAAYFSLLALLLLQ